jgi:uncharacterized Fe-S cluster-containing MiaB family protein
MTNRQQRYRKAGRLKSWWARLKNRIRIIWRARRDKKRGINNRENVLKSVLGQMPEFNPTQNINDAETLKIIQGHPPKIEQAEQKVERLLVELTKSVHPFWLRIGIGIAFLAEFFGAVYIMSTFGYEAFTRAVMAAMFALSLFALAYLAVKVGMTIEEPKKGRQQ